MNTFLNNIFRALFANVQLPHISFAASILRGGTEESLDPHGNKHHPKIWSRHPQHAPRSLLTRSGAVNILRLWKLIY